MAGIYSAGSVTSKNALWVAISSTVAAICLFTSVMNREANSKVSTGGLESAVDALVRSTSDAVSKQEQAAQGFVNSLADSLKDINAKAQANCQNIDGAVNGGQGYDGKS